MARLLTKYRDEVVPKLVERFGYKNRMAVPKLQKIVVNVGAGRASDTPALMEQAVKVVSVVTGQRPMVTTAKKSISGFKLREGAKVGCMATLRGKRMYEFLDRLISTAMPRIRDFRGLSPHAFDKAGNYSMGVTEQIVFPEVNPDDYQNPQGLQVTMVIDSHSQEESLALLSLLGMPFRSA